MENTNNLNQNIRWPDRVSNQTPSEFNSTVQATLNPSVFVPGNIKKKADTSTCPYKITNLFNLCILQVFVHTLLKRRNFFMLVLRRTARQQDITFRLHFCCTEWTDLSVTRININSNINCTITCFRWRPHGFGVSGSCTEESWRAWRTTRIGTSLASRNSKSSTWNCPRISAVSNHLINWKAFVGGYRRFGQTYCLHLQGQKTNAASLLDILVI